MWEKYEAWRRGVSSNDPDWYMDADRAAGNYCERYSRHNGVESVPSLAQIECLFASGFYSRIRIIYRGEWKLDIGRDQIGPFITWMRQYRIDEIAEALKKTLPRAVWDMLRRKNART